MKLEIIAELAAGHMGHVDRCVQLIEAAHGAGAGAVKFQFYIADELCPPEHPDYRIFKDLEFTNAQWDEVTGVARKLDLGVYGDVFGDSSFAAAARLALDGFKVHAADTDNRLLIEKIAQTGKAVLISTGGRRRIEIYEAIKLIRTYSKQARIVIMPGHQLFPTPIEEHSLEEISWFAAQYADLGVGVGCSDHIDGDQELAVIYPAAAAGAGAAVIEKHLTMNRADKWEDYEAALEPAAFERMVQYLRSLEKTLPYPVWTEGRANYRKKMVKSYAAARDIAAGENVAFDDLKYLQFRDGAEPVPSRYVKESKAAQKIAREAILTGTDLKQNIGVLVYARSTSTRLPAKALHKIQGRETVALLMERMRACSVPDQVVLCTTDESADDVLEELGRREGVPVFRGSNENVALRLLGAAREFGFDHIVRVTGDDLLRDVDSVDAALTSHLHKNADYTCMENLPYGCDSEIISVRALEAIVERCVVPENTEYLSWYLDDPTAFVQNVYDAGKDMQRDYRLSLDTGEDLAVFEAIFAALYRPPEVPALRDILAWLDQHPETARLNQHIRPKLDRSSLDLTIRI